MKPLSSFLRNSLPLFALLLVLTGSRAAARTNADNASATQGAPAVPQRITQAIDETQLVRQKGNLHPLARPEFDQGPVSDTVPMNRMFLMLKRSPEQELALQQYMSEQMRKDSPNFQKWLITSTILHASSLIYVESFV